MLHRNPDAETAFQRALAIEPQSAPALLDLADLQLSLNRADDAGKPYERLAALPDKRFRPAHAAFLFNRGQYDAAIKEFEQLAAQDPKDQATRIRLVQAYHLTQSLRRYQPDS